MADHENTLIYLAAPYSHKDKNIMIKRFWEINAVAARFMAAGLYVFSPISHTHPIAEAGTLPRGWEFWEGYDRVMISRCNNLHVLMLDGWKESTGVTAEIEIAKEFGMPVYYVTPECSVSLTPPE